MRAFIACLLISFHGFASVQAILENYPFSPQRRYPPTQIKGDKPQIDKVQILGYVSSENELYVLVREEGKVKRLRRGDEFMGMKILGVQRGFILARDEEGVKRIKISWEKGQGVAKPAEAPAGRGDEPIRQPPKKLMELLQEGK
ncbi:MAG: hypothetical protein ACK42C_04585 [Aquificaceae bacterium]|jgi:hypothetical protein|uniref:hypothetical protein n=1 Tax=Hydrogenobacter sp. Uz 6-8 TaxID=3384828 RepID=UPI000F1916A0|nr:MAG: hypothetical protein D6804_01255 [Aquificota bacterium]